MISLKPLTLAAFAALPGLTTAYVTGFTSPASVAAGISFNATLTTASYPQRWTDLGIIWGLFTTTFDCEACVGLQIGYTALTGVEGAAYPYTFDDVVTVPAGTTAGEYTLKAALPNVIGVSASSLCFYRDLRVD